MSDTTTPVDQGTRFGTWDDPVSRFMYHDSTREWLTALQVPTHRPTVDLGGANGLLRTHFTRLTTVDLDPAKQPDVVADITTWTPSLDPPVDLAVIRYVLHYLDDPQVTQLMETVATYTGDLVVVQFTNDDLGAKRANSKHEGHRWFRTTQHTHRLLTSGPWNEVGRWQVPYTVTPGFYRNRLGPGHYKTHRETLMAVRLRKDPTHVPHH